MTKNRIGTIHRIRLTMKIARLPVLVLVIAAS
jgi:hypothetical protein